MVGGGRDALSWSAPNGDRLDGKIDLVAVRFLERRNQNSPETLLDPTRVYPDYQTMVERELNFGGRTD
jgi:hypothetical protein